ncbi:MAG: DUF3416 domain-containing protein, partial [Chloroflexi bacterium]|nr:DUF3416 domain-containing protein [Chloroflexota bacterium]
MRKRQKSVVIENVHPELDAGRYPVKREVGETFEVSADIFKEGHDALAAVLKYRRRDGTEWNETPMRFVDNDRWSGSFPLEENTRYVYTIEAYKDVWSTYRDELGKKTGAGQDVTSELLEGQKLVRQAAERAEPNAADRDRLAELAEAIRPQAGIDQAARLTLGDELTTLMGKYPDRCGSSVYERELEVVVDRVKARYAAWYEFFPRSAGTVPGRSATFREAEARLVEIASMGFDVVYLPPIHPIGRTHRKGPNNTLVAGPNDPGVPYAIGNEQGGHKAVEPSLGTLADFDHFVAATQELGMEVALDFAIQCSPDHPYVKEHPEWFYHRPDGTIKYAE